MKRLTPKHPKIDKETNLLIDQKAHKGPLKGVRERKISLTSKEVIPKI